MDSREATRLGVGVTLGVLLISQPLLGAIGFYFFVRKMTADAVRTTNVVFASTAFLIMFIGASGCRWAGSPPPQPGKLSVRLIAAVVVSACWLSGAVGLFRRSRIAWAASAIGAAGPVCVCLTGLVDLGAVYISPDADMQRMQRLGLAGYIVELLLVSVIVCVIFLMSAWLVAGLLCKRKELTQDQPSAIAQ